MGLFHAHLWTILLTGANIEMSRLIAIMLGRLRMGIQETIDAYLTLAKDVFQEKPGSLLVPGVLGAMVGRARFSGTKLATAVKRVVKEQTGDENTSFFDSQEGQCRV